MVQIINNGMNSNFDSDNSLIFCRECNGSIILDRFKGDTICSKCGIIESEKEIDISNFSKNFYDNPQDAERNWTSFLFLLDISHATYIDSKKRSKSVNNRLIKIDSWCRTSKNLSEIRGLAEIKRVCSNLQIPFPTMAMAIHLFKKSCKNIGLKNRSCDAKVDGCIYYACLKHSRSILYHEIIAQNSVLERSFKKTYLLIIRMLHLTHPVMVPRFFLSKFIFDLGLLIDFENKAIKILDKIPPNQIQGKNPRGICAGLIYYTAKINEMKINQKSIANACHVSESSLRMNYQLIKKIVQV